MKKPYAMLLIGLILASAGIGYALSCPSEATYQSTMNSDRHPMNEAFLGGISFESLRFLVEIRGGIILKEYCPLNLLLIFTVLLINARKGNL